MPLGKRGHLRWLKKKIAISRVTCRLTDKLSNIEWDNVLQGANVNDDYDIFLKTFTETYNDCISNQEMCI